MQINDPIISFPIVLRSKNASPFEMTLDIIINTKVAYDQVKALDAPSAGVMSHLYAVKP